MLASCERQEDMDRNIDAELDADLLTLNVDKVSIGNIPNDFISFILDRPGDFCISTNSMKGYVISIRSDEEKTFHLALEKLQRGYRIRSMLFATGETIGELIYNIRDSSLDVLSGVLQCPVYPRRLITRNVLHRFRIFDKDYVISKQLSHEDYDFNYYRANILMNKEFMEVMLKEKRRMNEKAWEKYIFDELRVSYLAEELNLPVRTVRGIIVWAGGGYMIYGSGPGCDFPRFLYENNEKMNCGTKIKLCRALASVMSGLYNAAIYCGAVKLENFYVNYVDAVPCGQIQLVFAEGKDLTPLDKQTSVESGDFTQMAPEVTWTRVLTPESGVYSMGLVLRAVLEYGSKPSSKDPDYPMAQRVDALIRKCLSASPTARPTMNGIFIELDIISSKLTNLKSQRWTPV